MITIDEHGERMPNPGDYKDPDQYLPVVIMIENENDRTLLNEWVADGSIELKRRYRDKVDALTDMIIFDADDGKWVEIDPWQRSAVARAMEIRHYNIRRERS